MYQRQYLKTEPQTTAHLAQTMSLLAMNNGELIQEIEKMLNENPALERVDEIFCPQCHRRLDHGQICPKCSQPRTDNKDDSIVFLSPRSDFQFNREMVTDDGYSADDFTPGVVELPEYILKQIQYDLAEDERMIAAYFVTQIDDYGFISEGDASISQFFHVPISKVKNIREMIKRADPVGVGSQSPEEAMLVQMGLLGETTDIPSYYQTVLQDHLESLSKKDYKKIADQLNLEISDVKEAEHFILSNLNPYPGRASWGNSISGQSGSGEVYTNPDIIVGYLNNDPEQALLIEVIVPYGGNLQINSIYKDAMKDSGDEKKEDLKPDYEKANLLIKCLQQRNNTMRRLLEKIANYQVNFIRNGEKYLTPITRASLAKELEVHESTISRAVSNKSIQMPDGKIIPLSKFFDRSLGIRSELKEIIQKENKKKPLSDSKLTEMLNERGYDLARRTIAKYRAMENIFPAHMRKIHYEKSDHQ